MSIGNRLEGPRCRSKIIGLVPPNADRSRYLPQVHPPALYAAGWNDHQISGQKSFTDGRIIVAGATARRGPQKRADYLLRYRPNLMLAVVEAKAAYKNSRDGLQQAKE